MNLINDNRQPQSRPPVPQEDVNIEKELDDVDIPEIEETEPEIVEEHTEPTSPKVSKPKNNTVRTFLITLAMLVLIVIVVYYGFYKRYSSNTSDMLKTSLVVNDKTVADSINQDSAESITPQDDVADSADQEGVESNLPIDETAVEDNFQTNLEPTQNNVNTGIGRVAAMLSSVKSSLSNNLKLETLYLDENMFSLEVSSNNRQTTQSFRNQLTSGLPTTAQVMTGEDQITSSRALINGQFVGQPKVESVQTDLTVVKQIIEAMIQDANVQKEELSFGQKMGNKTPVFIKINGTLDECSQFVNLVSHRPWNMSVSKVIIMPARSERFTTVLRLYIVN